MRCIIGQRHKDKILSLLKPNSRMLEWGAGGSTVWFSEHLPAGAKLTSIEHDPKWYKEVQANLREGSSVRLLLREATGPLGRNATIEEEATEPLQEFVQAPQGDRFDLIFVDGNARSACLRQAKDLLAPGGIVLLHDAQRGWYDEAKREFIEYGHIGSCPDYPVPHLWWGGREQQSASKQGGRYPLIVSYFTKNTHYEQEAQKLIESCKQSQVEYRVEGVAAQGSWEANCSYKADFIYQMWRASGRPVLWVDADAVIHGPPELLRGSSADFACHKCRGWEFASGTLYFNQSEAAGTLLKRWLARCRRFPWIWDQVSLDLAWEDVVATHPLETFWLPEPYCRIFDLYEGRSTAPAVIEHFQASRRLKHTVSSAKPAAKASVTRQLVQARLASRVRPWQLSPADGVVRQRDKSSESVGSANPGLEESLLHELAEEFGRIQPQGRVLCLTPGVGVFWRMLQERGFEVHGIANDPAYAAQANTFCDGRIATAKPTRLPFPDGYFDGIVALGILEFLEDLELESALNEIRRVAKTKVFLVLQLAPDPEPRWPVYQESEWWLAKLAKAGLHLCSTANQTKPGHSALRRHLPLMACECTKDSDERPKNSPPVDRSECPVEPELRSFAGQLAQFFCAESLLQLNWISMRCAEVTSFGAHAQPLRRQRLDFDEENPTLPFGDEAFEASFNLATLAGIPDEALPGWLRELYRVTRNCLWIALEISPGRDRAWWERQFFAAGFRKHPLLMRLQSYSDLEAQQAHITLPFEKIPPSALERYPLSALVAERDLHMDMAREAGRRSDAHIARYMLACDYLPKEGLVLDAACGLGYGTASLAQAGGPGVKVVGLDVSDYAVDYARANFTPNLPNTEFRKSDVASLSAFADSSVDLVVSFETVEHLREPAIFLSEVERVLKPGGRFICSVPNLWVDNHGNDPNPWHYHVFDFAKIAALAGEFFELKAAYAQTAGGGMKLPNAPRSLQQVQLPLRASQTQAEWWIVVGEKSSVGRERPSVERKHKAARSKIMNEAPQAVWRNQAHGQLEHESASARHRFANQGRQRRAIIMTGNPEHALYSSWLDQCPVPFEVLNPAEAGARVTEDALILITHDTYVDPGRSLVCKAVAAGVPTLILADGILEFRNTFEHPQLEPGAVFRPVLGHKLATIGQGQTRVIESWGNVGKCVTVGLPRLDHYARLKRRVRPSQDPVRVLIGTALTPFFTETHRQKVLQSLWDLKAFFDRKPAFQGCVLEPIWRLTKGLDEQLGVSSTNSNVGSLEMSELLQTVDAVITTPSTSMLEAMLLGLPTCVLDYCNSPHYVAPAWRITAPTQIDDTISELISPPEAKLLFQETVLHNELECRTAATPRLLELIVRMAELTLDQRGHAQLHLPDLLLPHAPDTSTEGCFGPNGRPTERARSGCRCTEAIGASQHLPGLPTQTIHREPTTVPNYES